MSDDKLKLKLVANGVVGLSMIVENQPKEVERGCAIFFENTEVVFVSNASPEINTQMHEGRITVFTWGIVDKDDKKVVTRGFPTQKLRDEALEKIQRAADEFNAR